MSGADPPSSPDSVCKSDDGDILESASESSQTSSDILARFAQSLGESVTLYGNGQVEREDKAETKRTRKKKVKIPNIRIFYGDFVHSPSRGSLEILSKWLLGVEDGKVSQSLSKHLKWCSKRVRSNRWDTSFLNLSL